MGEVDATFTIGSIMLIHSGFAAAITLMHAAFCTVPRGEWMDYPITTRILANSM
jgi:hypothetical protein